MGRDYRFGQNDRLLLTVWNSLASVVVTVQGLMENDHGEFVPFAFQVTPTTDRVATVGSELLGEGYLHNLVVFASAGSPLRGQTYCRVTKRYGSQAVGIDTAVISQGYVADGQYLQYPGGRNEGSTEGPGVMLSIAGTNPAANVEVSEAVPSGALWRLISMHVTLVTDANAANRQVDFTISDGTTIFYRVQAEIVQTASLTWAYTFAAGAPVAVMTLDSLLLPAPVKPLLLAASIIATVTLNRQATDNWGAPQLLVEEWINP